MAVSPSGGAEAPLVMVHAAVRKQARDPGVRDAIALLAGRYARARGLTSDPTTSIESQFPLLQSARIIVSHGTDEGAI